MPVKKSNDKNNKVNSRKIKAKERIGLLRHGSIDFFLLIIVAGLLSVGLIMLLSASTPESLSSYGNSYTFFKSQLINTVIGLFAMFLIANFDYRFLDKHKNVKYIILAIIFILLLAVWLFGISKNGAKRWLLIGGLSLQPSEFIKVGFVVFIASLLSDIVKENKIKSIPYGFILPVAIVGFAAIMLFKTENHLSAGLIILVVTAVQMFTAGMNWGVFAAIVTGGVIGIFELILNISSDSSNFRNERIYTWLHLSESKSSTAYQIRNSLYAIGSGGLYGVGLNESKQKYLYLPEAQTDFIFSIVAEETGFIGSVAIILLFLLFIIRGITIAVKCEDMLGKLLAIGATAMIGVQVMMNLAVVTNSMPVTGVALPFFSYGGSAMIANLMAVGLLLSVSKGTKIKKEMKEEQE